MIKMKAPVWITSYCLTKGLQQCEIFDDKYDDGYVKVKEYPYSYFKIGVDVFFDRNAAIAACEELKIKKLNSLKKQIAKLEKLKF